MYSKPCMVDEILRACIWLFTWWPWLLAWLDLTWYAIAGNPISNIHWGEDRGLILAVWPPIMYTCRILNR
jgi:hypothetical protein